MQDVRYALRALRREPALVAGILLSFTLAIGANSAIFGLVRQLMLAPPPGVAHADRVGRVTLRFAGPDGGRYGVTTTSFPAFRAIASAPAFDATAAVRADTLTFGTGAATTTVAAIAATGRYFETLGAHPVLGRFFGDADDVAPAGNAVAVLSHAFWRRRFHGDASVLGDSVVIDGERFVVIGVAPAGFNGDGLASTDVFVPLSAAMRKHAPVWRDEPGMNVVSILARRRDGIAPSTAEAMATAAIRAATDPSRDDRIAAVELPSLVPGADAREAPQARVALWLAGVSLVVLLVATANVATLLLLRAVRRRREIAVRVALGVSRGRLSRQLLTESVVLALGGGVLALVASRWIADGIRLTLLPGIAPPDGFGAGASSVALATAVAAIGAGLLAGLAPLAQALRGSVSLELHGGGGERVAARQPTAQRALVLAQVALCTVLVTGAGLFLRSLDRVASQELGFSTQRLLYVTLDFRDRVPPHERDAIHTDAARRLTALAGVTGATVAQAVPFGPHHVPPISIPGRAEPPTAGGQLPLLYGATPEYLKLLGTRLREGRLLSAADGRGAPLVVLVNETMAREVWPGRSAIGRCIRIGFDPSQPPSPMAPASLPCREVVGVVADSRARSLRPDGREATLMQYYVPFEQLPAAAPFGGETPEVSGLLVGTSGDPERAAVAVQRLIQGTSPRPVYAHVRPYDDLLAPQLRPWRLGATLFSALGIIAVGIAAVGLLGVVSYVVARRTREIGVRLALGGERRRVGGAVVGEAVRMVAGGVVAGLVIALGAAPLVQPMLFQTSARDAIVLTAAATTLIVVTVAASALPAWRATRVNPLVALREE